MVAVVVRGILLVRNPEGAAKLAVLGGGTHGFHDEEVFPVRTDLHRLLVWIMIKHVGSGDHVGIAQHREASGTHLPNKKKSGRGVGVH